MTSSQSQPWTPVPLTVAELVIPRAEYVPLNHGSQSEIIVIRVATATILSAPVSRFRSKLTGGRPDERCVEGPDWPGWYWPCGYPLGACPPGGPYPGGGGG